jgi:TonB-dependent starch-binding outer membrane protein SusC
MKKLNLQNGYSRLDIWHKVLVLMLFGLMMSPSVFAQRTVTGQVTGADGAGIPSASVVIKGTTTGTVTDLDGNFSVNVSNNAVLVITSLGLTTQEIAVGNQSIIKVKMAEDAKTLGEVVVIGYGTSRKKDLTGSIATVNSKDFQKGNIASPEQLIAGKIAGVAITPGSGAPGAGSRIRIRGGSSLSADDPLIVVDGVPLANSEIGGISNPLALINPNDIESVNVLKDASAAAIYGSRASNGVIIVTTKKGKKGEAFKVGFSTVLSSAQPFKYVPVMTGDEFRELVMRVGNSSQKALLGKENTDWQKLIYRNAFSHDENLNFSGTLAKVLPYRLNLGYLNQNGILLGSNLDRKSVSLNVNPRLLDDHLKIDFSYKGSFAKSKFADEAAIGGAVGFDPTQAPRTGKENIYQGYFEWIDGAIPNPLAPRNPLGLLSSKQDLSNVNRSIVNAIADYKLHFFPDLHINMNVALDQANTNGTVNKDSSAASGFRLNKAGGTKNTYKQSRTAKTFETYLNYIKEGNGFRADVMAGYGYQDFYFEGENEFFNLIGVRQGDTTLNETRPKNQSTMVSFFGRANLGFKDRYLMTFTMRRDGSSRLAPGHKWITYPAVALAWRMTEDGIGKGLFSDLKLRLGYGITGQQDGISEYNGLKRFSVGGNTAQYPLGDKYYSTLRPEGFNELLTWQKTTTTNFGIDFAVKSGRLSGAIDYYFRETSGLFNDVNIPAGANFTNRIKSNIGTLENNGIELTLNTTPIKTAKLNWDANFVLGYNQNKITKLTLVEDPKFVGVETGGIAGGEGNNIQIHAVGAPKSSFYVYQQVYGEGGKPVEGLYVDRNADGKITVEDKYLFQKPDANYTLGFTSNLTYNDFSFGFVLRGSVGNYMYSNVNSGGTFGSNSLAFLYSPARNVLDTKFQNAQYFSDYYLQNASFLKMDNLTLGYNLSSLFKNKYTVQLTAVVQNVMTITNYTGVDPEIGNGIDNNIYLRPRTYSLGINVRF